jgi:hypothetical protein
MKPRPVFLLMIIAGGFGILLQFMPDPDLLTFIIVLSALTSAVGSKPKWDERENQLLGQSFSDAFQWTLIGLYILFTGTVLLGWIGLVHGWLAYVAAHWIGYIASAMCLLLGVAGLREFREEA